MKRYKSVDDYIDGESRWSSELKTLRALLKKTELVEGVKWGAPCYTINGQNVIGMMAFKDYFGLWFHQGVFLKDPDNVLMNAQEGKTKALRQWRMTSSTGINRQGILAYVEESITNAKTGKKMPIAKVKKLVMPKVFKNALRDNNAAAAAFDDLTPGKQREYADYITEAKREETKLKRIDKILPMIVSGVGLNDRYK